MVSLFCFRGLDVIFCVYEVCFFVAMVGSGKLGVLAGGSDAGGGFFLFWV